MIYTLFINGQPLFYQGTSLDHIRQHIISIYFQWNIFNFNYLTGILSIKTLDNQLIEEYTKPQLIKLLEECP